MTIIITLDDKNGISFNNRRQSRDRRLVERLLKIDPHVNIDDYSRTLFPTEHVGGSEEHFFVENRLPDLSAADRLIVFRWNRVYPSDITVDLTGWVLTETSEFAGNSHEKITEEIYERENVK